MRCTKALIVVVFAACPGCGVALSPTLEANGTVVYTDLEGGAWYVKTDDGQALGGFVPEYLRVVGQPVHVKYTVCQSCGSSLMIGVPVNYDVIEPG
jgi:hypothetical protein